ncbi:MAG: hypothetical protein CVV49_14125 [Spirochaetae bacterium HGW-Spirochaetae-5]|nr:MAG: hypothetical protein CVV49_14125 [Spirochaetae bacterium HGW-Spirochaetae-5]
MNKKIILSWTISTALIIAVSAFIIYSKEKALTGYVSAYQDMAYKAERGFIESIPVYRDFAKPAMISELTKFNLKDSAAGAAEHGIVPLKDIDDINANIKSGKLVTVDSPGEKLYYFHNVQKEYRYLTPQGKAGLELAAARFQQKIQAHKQGLPVVKLAISSVIRTVDYQEKIFGRKFVSTHSYGGCFDIFFEDYFVQLPIPDNTGSTEEKIRKSLHGRTGFLMGDALREQFHSVLMETLLELQRENRIYVFFEEENRCYHITVLAK